MVFDEINQEVRKQLLAFITEGERDSAVELISKWAHDKSYEQAVVDVLEPVLAEFGKDWGSSDHVSLGQGYILSKIAEDIFELAAGERIQSASDIEEKGPVVIGNIFDDSHGLGRKLVISFLQLDGWKVYDLGNDIDPEDFVDKAVEVDAPIIAASAMMLRTAMNIKELREEINSRGLGDQIKLAVGGAVFCQRPGLVEEVGGDGTAVNAIQAPALMEELIHQLES